MVGKLTRVRRDPRVRGAVGISALFLAVHVLALAAAPRLAGSGVSYGSGGDALVPLVLGLVVGTVLSLAVVRYGADRRLVRGVMLASLCAAQWFALSAFLGPVAGAVAALAGTLLAWRVPRPAVCNAVAVVGVAGGAALFGASLDPAYAAAALVVAAGYDAYAVYGSGHMLDVADASAALRVPSMFVVPTDDGDGDADAAATVTGGGRPAATLLGAGDALFPAMLTASVGVASSAPLAAGAPLVGSLVGLAALQVFVHRVRGVHAGLPLVNGGALAGWAALLLA
ncbi:presenilin family intramembrane aspartyl protease [Halobaculum gomorrense]|uniref:Presenilin-like membrane protease, A22 family n=1 Tax=Halobaculum gomorrense TaxID=43928 RepID=A0A1M5P2J7_9EURY|nr:presenilin family intramembrane aspartyl protease [Halobaculum gomorrense]SHG96046.1 Presenilin-like membrane protease, A22 family [Halobaculum gomorrense]